LILDSRGQVSDCNPAAEAMLDGAIKGKSWRELIAEKFNPRLDDGHEISLKNGRRLSLLTRSLDDEPGQLIVLNDLTETRGLQQQISRNQRLSTMGKMISSLAHQIRTPLTAAMLYADQLLSGVPDSESVSRYGEKILSRLQNMERQIRDMLIFARGETELHDEVSVTELIASLREATGDLPQAAAQNLIWKIANTDIRLNCNIDTLIGALLNLIENALQASTASQQVTIAVELSNATRDHRSQRLRIAVEDEGSGIDAELLARLEEPFITTKSQGTGLGLSIVRLVAKAHRGQFRLIPRPDKGVCAELILPVDTIGRV
jgi:two-component system sensor histidine kinase FlrB